MEEVTLIGIDLGKHSFHLHAQDKAGRMVFRKKLNRQQVLRTLVNFPPCRIAIESCAGAHWLARRLAAMGHDARLIAPQFAKPFVQGNKNDFADAQTICEAACRPSMRFASPRNEVQQTASACLTDSVAESTSGPRNAGFLQCSSAAQRVAIRDSGV